MLKGAENTCKSTMKPSRKVVTIPILKLIGHEIAGLNWSSYSKQVYWAACCTSFFGSTRMGELLAENTVGAKIMTHTRIMACGTSGDDLMHLKTSHNKSRVIL
jgi:hypothetical protein